MALDTGSVAPADAVNQATVFAGPLHLFVLPIRHWRGLAVLVFVVATASGLWSILMPPRYATTATFVPESGESIGLPAGLAGVAAQFGVVGAELGSRGSHFYASLLRSRVVLRTLLATPINTGQGTVPLIELLDVPIQDPVRTLEAGERELASRIGVTVDRVTQRVTFSVWMRDTAVVRAVADSMLTLLDRYNRQIRRSTAGDKRAFLEGQVALAAESLGVAEEAMQTFLVNNRSFEQSPQLMFQRERLGRTIGLRQEIYLALSRQLAEAKVQEVDTRPVVTVVDPPVAPSRRSWPRRKLVVAAATFSVLALAWLVILLRAVALGHVAGELSDGEHALREIKRVGRDIAGTFGFGHRSRG